MCDILGSLVYDANNHVATAQSGLAFVATYMRFRNQTVIHSVQILSQCFGVSAARDSFVFDWATHRFGLFDSRILQQIYNQLFLSHRYGSIIVPCHIQTVDSCLFTQSFYSNLVFEFFNASDIKSSCSDNSNKTPT